MRRRLRAATDMDSSRLLGLASFALVMTLTPGPNNLIVASLGVQVGLPRTLSSIYGVAVGFCALMLVCGTLAGVLLETFPAVATWIRWFGSAYILWLAYQMARSGFHLEPSRRTSIGGFWPMVGFQFLNPKAVTFGLTVYSAFLADYVGRTGYVVVTGVSLGAMALAATLTWATFGSLFNRYLDRPGVRGRVRIVVVLLLVYAAVDLLRI